MDAPDRTPPSPPRLTSPPLPEADWGRAPGHALMKSNDPAKAETMGRGAAINGNRKHAYQAGAPRPRLQYADVPMKAARAFRKTLGAQLSP